MGITGKLHLARVNNHQFGVLPGGSFNWYGRHVVLFSYVGVENQDAAGPLQVPDGVGSRGVSQGPFQGPDQIGLGIGGLVHVVGAHDHPGEFLGQVMLLVGAARRGQEREAVSLIIG